MTPIQMMTTRRAALLSFLLLGACNSKNAARTDDTPTAQAATGTTACQPMEELREFDPRQPVPLQPMMAWHQKQNMMEHLVAIQRIAGGLAQEDWEEVASASALIETSPQMRQMCQHMGAGAAGFTEMALDFHRRADAIGEAARAHDGPAVLRATSNTLQACTGCHAVFRQEVVDVATWQERTGSTHDPAKSHGH